MPEPNEADRAHDVETGRLPCDEGSLRFGPELSRKVSGYRGAAGREPQESVFAGKSSRESGARRDDYLAHARSLAKRRTK